MTRVVVEVLDSHDRVHARERLVLGGANNRFTVGRGVAADVMIDDRRTAALHAAVELGADGRWRISDLGSINGVIVGGKRHRGATDLALPDGRFQLGRTRLRVRGGHETLEPERLDRGHAGALSEHLPAIAVAGAIVCAAFTVYFAWLVAPRDSATIIAAGLVSLFIGAGVWIALWALLTRVMRGEARWLTHAAIILGIVALLLAMEWAIALGWFAFSLPQLPLRDEFLIIMAAAVALYWHITTALRIRRRTALVWALVVPLLVVGNTTWMDARKHARDVNFIAERAQLYPPSLRLRQGGTVDFFFERAAGLKNDADRKRKAIAGDDAGDASGADDD